MFTNIFKPTKRPKEVQIPFDVNKDVKKEFIQHLGYIPFVYFDDLQIEQQHLIYFQLFLKENIPQVQITFVDATGLMSQRGFPLDNTKLKVFINTRSDESRTIFLEFKIINVKKEPGMVITLKGAIDIDDLYTINYESFANSSSIEVLQKVSKQLGLGFNTNINVTNDRMNWLNYGRKVYQFLKYVTNNGYISDNDFCSYYIDYYYNLNYINLQKELLRDVSNDELIQDNFLPETITGEKQPPQKSKAILTTDYIANSTNVYISDFKVLNNSTSISIQEGYLKQVFYYDNQKKEKLIFELDTLSDDTDRRNLIDLKSPGQGGKEFYKSNFTQEYIGKLDVDNIHANYNYADFINNRNLQELEKITLIATLPHPNFSLYIFQKISVAILNQFSDLYNKRVNERLTGNYLITNIKFEYSSKGMIQILHLSRRDLSITDLELPSKI